MHYIKKIIIVLYKVKLENNLQNYIREIIIKAYKNVLKIV